MSLTNKGYPHIHDKLRAVTVIYAQGQTNPNILSATKTPRKGHRTAHRRC